MWGPTKSSIRQIAGLRQLRGWAWAAHSLSSSVAIKNDWKFTLHPYNFSALFLGFMLTADAIRYR